MLWGSFDSPYFPLDINDYTVCPVKFGTVSGETKISKNHKNSSITSFQVFNIENGYESEARRFLARRSLPRRILARWTLVRPSLYLAWVVTSPDVTSPDFSSSIV